LKNLLALIAFSVLLLVPVGAQQVFADHPELPCPPPGILNKNSDIVISGGFEDNFCYILKQVGCPIGYTLQDIRNMLLPFEFLGSIFEVCLLAPPLSTPDPTLTVQCQGAAVLLNNHCFAQIMSVVGGILLDIDNWSLFVANIGVNPVITGLVAITMAGVAGQAAWFIHRRKKKVLN